MQIQKNISLSKYTTFKVGGIAKYFCIAKNKKEIIQALKYAQKNKLKYLILGKGSNLLISDNGFNGLVIKLENQKIKIKNNTIYAEAGANLQKLVHASSEHNLTGLEWSAGIPGTLGGAIRGNAGAFESFIADTVQSVEVIDIKKNFQSLKLTKNFCQFSYRDSIFKHKKNYIILSAILKLKKGNSKEIKEKIKKYLIYRKKNHPLNFPSAGSVFKNIAKIKNPNPVMQILLKKLNFIPAGWLIEQSGLKGKCIGKACVSKKHCNFIVNQGNAKTQDIYNLIVKIQKTIYNKFKIKIKPEIQLVGFKSLK